MQLRIVTLTEATFLLDFSASAKQVTADVVKMQLAKQIGFPASRISLVFRGMELKGDLEHKPLLKLFPDFHSKDFFVLIYRKPKKRSRSEKDSSKPTSKQQKTASAATQKSEKQSVRSGSSDMKSSQGSQLTQFQEMRDFLRKFGERRARAQSRPLEPKDDLLAQLTTMGFKQEAATRALLLHRNNLEMSLNWLLENASDPDINKPISSNERQQLSRVASRAPIPMEALNDFIEISYGRNQSPPGGEAIAPGQESCA
uniref:UBA domain-containing protein n=1 Tax=Lotharella oceanica TaxID=641309 RepID=A0A7S2TMN2_9EUKA|mmetsp:Transcript_21277/g.39884  ORF Transcript_21277/g.39884 Transcript_21277/m.39884 type:complete len:257 (+) Transcript_21277:95-865(+)